MTALSKRCPECGLRFTKPEKGGMARWMRQTTCLSPRCVRTLQKRLQAQAEKRRVVGVE